MSAEVIARRKERRKTEREEKGEGREEGEKAREGRDREKTSDAPAPAASPRACPPTGPQPTARAQINPQAASLPARDITTDTRGRRPGLCGLCCCAPKFLFLHEPTLVEWSCRLSGAGANRVSVHTVAQKLKRHGQKLG